MIRYLRERKFLPAIDDFSGSAGFGAEFERAQGRPRRLRY
jgi:hypothetical protein